ncbi:hypothetical protein A2803_02820 [Candidatus Woesebacteria bacterium RIFCSPHIGHO2_01_FULL_44_21]|uniref:Antitoxin n=1 Tax=Candidatus Woesebacteria bacterium RIFCSPHIGHO2_01_FULL_44_21 TaxID=1802503 RepID=A0A1F7YZ45_9BACT|nr:MAG: hypothetical protein A2803_02820 [Candidatus Woesebacteria bacterium RIFCSPHIGHO2_01_FULL_44_21]OGM69794.1 MAG: hypothetical protein A2897_00425 [Candidatus Woesebacteria bacterium RIFCSPLOWO2_01_FULL_44_24b]
MLIINIHEAKANLSHYLDLVQRGKKVIVAKRNIPIAEIKSLSKFSSRRIIGQSKEKFEIPDSFFEPLPKSVINSFNNPK